MFKALVHGVVVFAFLTGCAESGEERFRSAQELDESEPVAESASALYYFPDAALGNTWPVEFGTVVRDSLTGVATDIDGGVYVTGATDGNMGGVDAGPVGQEFFIAGFRANGEYDWWDTLGTISNDTAYDVSLNSGGVYVTGVTHGALHGQTNVGNGDVFLSKFNNRGVRQWTTQLGTSALDIGMDVALVDGIGLGLVVGSTRGGFPNYVSQGGSDAFLARYIVLGLPVPFRRSSSGPAATTAPSAWWATTRAMRT